MTTHTTEIAALYAKRAELERIAEAASEHVGPAHARFLASAPTVPEAIRIDSSDMLKALARRFVKAGWHGVEFNGWQPTAGPTNSNSAAQRH